MTSNLIPVFPVFPNFLKTPLQRKSLRGIRNIGKVGAAVLVAALSACASAPQIDAQWTDSAIAANSKLLHGARVMVACEAYDLAVRQVCQEQLAAQVSAIGAIPVPVPGDTPVLMNQPLDGQLLPEARQADARAVLVVTLTPASAETSSGLSLGIGGFGFGRNSAVGVGVSAPIGGGHVSTGFSANGRITDAATGRLIWTASASAPPSSDLNAQFAALSKTVLESASKSGLF